MFGNFAQDLPGYFWQRLFTEPWARTHQQRVHRRYPWTLSLGHQLWSSRQRALDLVAISQSPPQKFLARMKLHESLGSKKVEARTHHWCIFPQGLVLIGTLVKWLLHENWQGAKVKLLPPKNKGHQSWVTPIVYYTSWQGSQHASTLSLWTAHPKPGWGPTWWGVAIDTASHGGREDQDCLGLPMTIWKKSFGPRKGPQV